MRGLPAWMILTLGVLAAVMLYVGYGLVGVWAAYIGYRALQAFLFAGMWRAGRWATIRI